MAVLRCKMCGAPLPITPGVTVVECESCWTQQTVPSADNEKKLNLFTRAERLRSLCEFDKAAGVFEAIVADFPEEAEAYWGLVLCKYGIEYVDDPATGKKIPTCHRSSFDRVVDDQDYEMALTYADVLSKAVYVQEARQIEEIRKGIIAVSANADPYDIFICYKETAEDGGRTLDSVLAQDIYDVLTDKGYRVFFARITLEDKLGQEYEPYIFAALNSAKIMLAVGTDFEHFNAVWVRNEWSRYLKLMAEDRSRHLIPCYKGLDAYDMPKEFAKLQAQDLGKVGAMQDLVRGIEKILPRQVAAATPEWAMLQGDASQNSVAAWLKRAFQFISEENWAKGDEYLEKVLDILPECAEAFMGKLMLEFRVTHETQLGLQNRPISGSRNYQKVMNYGDPGIRQRLENYCKQVEQRIVAHNAHVAELESKKQVVLQQVQKSNQIMNEAYQRFTNAEKKVKDRAEQLLQSQATVGELEANYKKIWASGKNQAIPVWIVLLILAVCATLAFSSTWFDWNPGWICFLIAAVTLVISGIRTSVSTAAAILVNVCIAGAVFIVVLIFAFGMIDGGRGVLGALGYGVIHLVIGLIAGIFGGGLEDLVSPEAMAVTHYVTTAVCLFITMSVSIKRGLVAAGEKGTIRQLEKKLEQAKQTVYSLQTDTATEQKLIADMEEMRKQYHISLQKCRGEIHAVNDEYTRTADKYHLKAELLIPELYK